MSGRTPLPDEVRRPARSRLPLDHPHRDLILGAHDRALDAGRPAYADPVTGYWVFTAAYLWDRGYCCESGCRHCPFVER